MIEIDTTDISILLGSTFAGILALILLTCYLKKVLNLFDFFTTDFFPSSFGKDKKDKNC